MKKQQSQSLPPERELVAAVRLRDIDYSEYAALFKETDKKTKLKPLLDALAQQPSQFLEGLILQHACVKLMLSLFQHKDLFQQFAELLPKMLGRKMFVGYSNHDNNKFVLDQFALPSDAEETRRFEYLKVIVGLTPADEGYEPRAETVRKKLSGEPDDLPSAIATCALQSLLSSRVCREALVTLFKNHGTDINIFKWYCRKSALILQFPEIWYSLDIDQVDKMYDSMTYGDAFDSPGSILVIKNRTSDLSTFRIPKYYRGASTKLHILLLQYADIDFLYTNDNDVDYETLNEFTLSVIAKIITHPELLRYLAIFLNRLVEGYAQHEMINIEHKMQLDALIMTIIDACPDMHSDDSTIDRHMLMSLALKLDNWSWTFKKAYFEWNLMHCKKESYQEDEVKRMFADISEPDLNQLFEAIAKQYDAPKMHCKHSLIVLCNQLLTELIDVTLDRNDEFMSEVKTPFSKIFSIINKNQDLLQVDMRLFINAFIDYLRVNSGDRKFKNRVLLDHEQIEEFMMACLDALHDIKNNVTKACREYAAEFIFLYIMSRFHIRYVISDRAKACMTDKLQIDGICAEIMKIRKIEDTPANRAWFVAFLQSLLKEVDKMPYGRFPNYAKPLLAALTDLQHRHIMLKFLEPYSKDIVVIVLALQGNNLYSTYDSNLRHIIHDMFTYLLHNKPLNFTNISLWDYEDDKESFGGEYGGPGGETVRRLYYYFKAKALFEKHTEQCQYYFKNNSVYPKLQCAIAAYEYAFFATTDEYYTLPASQQLYSDIIQHLNGARYTIRHQAGQSATPPPLQMDVQTEAAFVSYYHQRIAEYAKRIEAHPLKRASGSETAGEKITILLNMLQTVTQQRYRSLGDNHKLTLPETPESRDDEISSSTNKVAMSL